MIRFLKKMEPFKNDEVKVLQDKKNDSNVKYMFEFFNWVRVCAFNDCVLHSQEQKAVGVIAASAGNHALALSYHGQCLGIPVTVVMPLIAPMMKVQACRSYGANVIIQGNDISEVGEILL